MIEKLTFKDFEKICDEALENPNLWLTLPIDAMTIFLYQKDDKKYLVWAMDTDNGFKGWRAEIPPEPMELLRELDDVVKDDILYYLLINFPEVIA